MKNGNFYLQNVNRVNGIFVKKKQSMQMNDKNKYRTSLKDVPELKEDCYYEVINQALDESVNTQRILHGGEKK